MQELFEQFMLKEYPGMKRPPNQMVELMTSPAPSQTISAQATLNPPEDPCEDLEQAQEETTTASTNTVGKTSKACFERRTCHEAFKKMAGSWTAGYPEKNFAFASKLPNYTKGCYGYKSGLHAGHYYFGIGGTESDKSSALSLPAFRPSCPPTQYHADLNFFQRCYLHLWSAKQEPIFPKKFEIEINTSN